MLLIIETHAGKYVYNSIMAMCIIIAYFLYSLLHCGIMLTDMQLMYKHVYVFVNCTSHKIQVFFVHSD